VLLILRLTLVPVLVAGVTLASRRWGPRVGGFVNALPAVAGPTFCFYAVQQGNAFAATAARGTLLGLVSLSVFCVAYAHASRRMHWPLCLLIGWLTFGVVTLLVYRVNVDTGVGLLAAIAALLGARMLLPASEPVPPETSAPRWDLPLRMLSTAALVFTLTAIAQRLGPTVSGLLTPFPVATSVLAGFTHVQRGSDAVVAFFRGLLPALCGFAVFCTVLAVVLPVWTLVASVSAALAVQLAVQALFFSGAGASRLRRSSV
jgi:hypothetical protein